MFKFTLIVLLGFIALVGASGHPNEKGLGFQSRVCIFIETDLLVQDMEIGNIYLNLAQTIKEAGHQVTLLTDEPVSNLESKLMPLQLTGINFQYVPSMPLRAEYTPAHLWKSYALYEFLKTQQFDVVHAADYKGYLYYSVLAKHQGLHFPHTLFVIGLQTPYMFGKIANQERVVNTEPLEFDFMQKHTVEWADVVISPSQYMLTWAKQNGWNVPNNTVVQPNLISSLLPRQTVTRSQLVFPSEIVFYGDLSPCQGLIIFCDAIDKLILNHAASLPSDLSITFLGKPRSVQGVDATDYIQARSKKWNVPSNLISFRDNVESIRYLMRQARLAVVAPEKANSPLRIQDLLYSSIPFIASNVGGVSELLTSDSAVNVLFAARSDKLADKILNVIHNGIEVAQPSQSYEQTKQQYVSLYSTLRASSVSSSNSNSEDLPLVSVIITHFNRHEFLRQAIASVERQDYPNLELILVDDSSTSIESQMEVANLKSYFATKNWKLIVLPENSYLGKTRNVGVANAKGKYILFLDDDNIARSNEVSTFVKVAEKTGADLLTSVQDYFYGVEPPTDFTKPFDRRVPMGGDPATGFYWNCYGDANSWIRKSSFESVGGFTEDFGLGFEDYEFFSKCVLRGLKLEVIPEPLFWYRKSNGDSMSGSTPIYNNRMRGLRPYLEHYSQISNLLILAQSLHVGVSGQFESPHMGASFVGEDNCSAAISCGNCTMYAGCGWCPADGTCQPGNATHPFVSSNCSDGSNGWTTKGSGVCVDCPTGNSDCDNCTAVSGCGYCSLDSMCYQNVNGTAVAITSPCKSQVEDFQTECPSGSDKKKIAIIVGCSVAGGLILIAAIGTAAFFYWSRNRHRGYTPINQG